MANMLVGKQYKDLTVISRAESKNNRRYWKCLCRCGRTKIIIGTNLIRGRTSSCGKCSHPEITFRTLNYLTKRWGRPLEITWEQFKELWKVPCCPSYNSSDKKYVRRINQKAKYSINNIYFYCRNCEEDKSRIYIK